MSADFNHCFGFVYNNDNKYDNHHSSLHELLVFINKNKTIREFKGFKKAELIPFFCVVF